MQIKFKGLNIKYEKGKPLGFILTREAVKEFCDYHKIPYNDKDFSINGVVTTRKWAIHTKMVCEFSKIEANNNWRKRHRIPMRRKCFDAKKELKSRI